MRPFARDIWIEDGPAVVAIAGFHYPTRMAVIRLSGGALFIWSPTALTPALRREIAALGTVGHIVAPNAMHHVFLPEWRRAFPGAMVHAAPGLRKKRPDIGFDADLGDAPHPDWEDAIDQVVVPGNVILREVVFFHAPSRTAIVADLLQQLPPGWFSGWRARVAKLDLMVGPEPSTPRKFRAAFTDRRAARGAVARMLAWPAEKLLMAHGAPVEADGQAVLRRAFTWLTR